MEQFSLQVMLKDGSFADFEVKTARDSGVYEVLKGDSPVATFESKKDGTWQVTEDHGTIDADLRQRIIEQLKGYRT